MAGTPLDGRTIGVTADRRAEEQARLFRDRGARIVHGPALQTVDLSTDVAVRTATAALIAQPPDYVVATTGLGIRRWLEAAETWGWRTALLDALGGAKILARGPKSSSALRGAGLDVWWAAPTERMEDVVARLQLEPLARARVALQLFDPHGHPSTSALAALAGDLVEVPVYEWALPADTAPVRHLLDLVLDGGLDAVTFTAQPAVRNLFVLAGSRSAALRAAFNGPVAAVCVGPVCAQAALDAGIADPWWPDPPRLVAMVRMATERLAG